MAPDDSTGPGPLHGVDRTPAPRSQAYALLQRRRPDAGIRRMRSFVVFSLGLSAGMLILFFWIPIGLGVLRLEQPVFSIAGISCSAVLTAVCTRAISARVTAASPGTVRLLSYFGAVALLSSLPLYVFGIVH